MAACSSPAPTVTSSPAGSTGSASSIPAAGGQSTDAASPGVTGSVPGRSIRRFPVRNRSPAGAAGLNAAAQHGASPREPLRGGVRPGRRRGVRVPHPHRTGRRRRRRRSPGRERMCDGTDPVRNCGIVSLAGSSERAMLHRQRPAVINRSGMSKVLNRRAEVARETHRTRRRRSLLAVQIMGELLITFGVIAVLFVAWQLWWTNVEADAAQGAAVKQFVQEHQVPVTNDPSGTLPRTRHRRSCGPRRRPGRQRPRPRAGDRSRLRSPLRSRVQQADHRGHQPATSSIPSGWAATRERRCPEPWGTLRWRATARRTARSSTTSTRWCRGTRSTSRPPTGSTPTSSGTRR